MRDRLKKAINRLIQSIGQVQGPELGQCCYKTKCWTVHNVHFIRYSCVTTTKDECSTKVISDLLERGCEATATHWAAGGSCDLVSNQPNCRKRIESK